MAREKSYLPPVELESERQSLSSKEEVIELSKEEQKEAEQSIISDDSTAEKLPETEVSIPQKPAEKSIPVQPTEQVAHKDSVPVKPAIPEPPKQEIPVRTTETAPPPGSAFTVQVGFFSNEANARGLAKEIENKGYQVFVIKHNNFFKVQVGAYSTREQAEEVSRQLKRINYETWVTQR